MAGGTGRPGTPGTPGTPALRSGGHVRVTASHPSRPGAGARLVGRLLAPGAVGLRLVAFTVVCSVTWVLLLLPGTRPAGAGPTAWSGMWLGLVMVLGAQAAGTLVPWHRVTTAWQAVPPLLQMGALVVLHHGSGAALTSVDALVLLPVVSLGLQATWSGVVLATAGTAGVQLAVVLGGPTAGTEPFLPRTVVVSLIALAVALGAAGAARRLRAGTNEHGALDEHGAPTAVTATRDPTAGTQDEFLGLVGHELRSPLTSVLGYAQLLGADSLTDQQHKYVEVIERNGQRLRRLIDELLLVAQISAGELRPDRRETDLARVARASGRDLDPTALAGGVSLTVEAPRPVPVSGDPGLLAQVVTSLLSNAIKRTPSGRTVTLRVGPGKAPRTAVVEVADTGAGLPPDELARLADHHAPDAPGHRPPLLGLGLPVAQAVVHAHGGTLTVDSTTEGTSVTVTLPAGPPTEAPSAPR